MISETMDTRIESAFSRWLDLPEKDIDYSHTLTCVRILGFSISELHEILEKYKDRPNFERAGMFASAVYNSVPENDIVFDLELPAIKTGLGALLPKEKRLLNYGDTGKSFGYGSNGTIVNYGKTGWNMGARSSGLVVNVGTRGLGFGADSRGTLIDFGDVAFHPSDNFRYDNAGFKARGMMIMLPRDQRVLRHDTPLEYFVTEESLRKNEGLKDYLLRLRDRLEEGSHNPKKAFEFLNELGSEPAERIREDVYRLVDAPPRSLKRFFLKANRLVRLATS